MYNTYVHRGRYKAGRQANWAQALENVKLIFRKTHKHIKQILIYVCANVFQIHFGICVGESVRCMDGIERVSARYVSLSRTKDPSTVSVWLADSRRKGFSFWHGSADSRAPTTQLLLPKTCLVKGLFIIPFGYLPIHINLSECPNPSAVFTRKLQRIPKTEWL